MQKDTSSQCPELWGQEGVQGPGVPAACHVPFGGGAGAGSSTTSAGGSSGTTSSGSSYTLKTAARFNARTNIYDIFCKSIFMSPRRDFSLLKDNNLNSFMVTFRGRTFRFGGNNFSHLLFWDSCLWHLRYFKDISIFKIRQSIDKRTISSTVTSR